VSQPYQQPPYGAPYAAPPAQAAAYAPEPQFQVRVAKHTGALVFWSTRQMTVTGTYAQCEAAISEAQGHCVGAGWWSIGSLLWNAIAISQNNRARNQLRQQAEHHRDYAIWWNTYHGPGPTTPVWTPPPSRPKSTWWAWIPLALFAAFLVVMITIAANSPHEHHSRSHRNWEPTSASQTLP
jgi:hypothetical protein